MAGPTPCTGTMCARAPMRLHFRLLLLLAALVLPLSCTIEITAPPQTGFLAIILTAQGASEVTPGQRYVLRIRELSGTYGIDDRFSVTPNDTLVHTYPLATYVINVDSVPAACTSRFGYAQQALISTAGNTSITRFNFVCNALLGIEVLADGNQVDSSFVWTVTAPGGTQRFGLADATDTVRINDVVAGDYTVELGHIADNCILTSDGWRRQTITIKPPVAGTVHFRVRCFNPARAPRVLHVASSIRNGVSGFYAEVADLDVEDGISEWAWNLTDCLGNPLFSGIAVNQDKLRYDRVFGVDTARIIVTVPVPEGNLDRACTAVRFSDLEGNTTRWLEEASRNETGRPPVVTTFDVQLSGGQLRTTLTATDPDSDLAGAFMTITFRDGSMFLPANGKPDIVAYNTAGYLPPFQIPFLNAAQLRITDIISVNVDVLDRAGNMSRAVDTNIER